MKKQFRLTKAGITELTAELEGLRVKRVETAAAIKSARELGDLSENAEYQTARQTQDNNDARIAEIENILANAEVIKGGKKSTVGLGATVSLKGAKKLELTVVGSLEADPLNGKISDESPIGIELLGKAVGDKVKVGKDEYKIVTIA